MSITVTDAVLFSTAFVLLFLSIFWIIVLFTAEPEKRNKPLRKFPFFTTIVPAFNEENSIVKTLTSLVNLDYPREKKEIIVVNDGSTDRTLELVEQFQKKYPQHNIILINQPNKGKASAMNNGLAHARGEFFACLDADSFIAPNALQKMLPYFEDKSVAAVCPLLKVHNPSTTLQKVQWHEYIINMFYKFLNAKLDCIHVTPGPFSVYRTGVIQKLGGYDERTLTEDLEIAIRLQKYHYRIIQTFDALAETNAPTSWKALFLQRVRWYKGGVDDSFRYRKIMFNKKYGDFGFLRLPTIILSGLIAVVLTITLLQETIMRSIRNFIILKEINFDIITLLKNYTFNFNFLSLPFFKYFIGIILIGTSIYIMIKSFQLVQEKITHYGRTWISMVVYLTVYSLFISTVWMYIAYMYVAGKKSIWHAKD